MSPTKTRLGAAAVKSRFSRFGAMGNAWGRVGGRTAEPSPDAADDAVLPHDAGHALAAHSEALVSQLGRDARSPVAALVSAVDGTNVHQQLRIIATADVGLAIAPGVVRGPSDPQDATE